MGREWYFNWGSKSSSKKAGVTPKGGRGGGDSGGGGGRGGGSQRKSMSVSRPKVATAAAAAAAAAAASGGCMNTVLHMFDFQHFNLCLHPNNSSYLPDDPTPLKGVEAPRNSLESITEDDAKKSYSLNIPKDIQVKTNRRDTRLRLVQAPRGKVEDTLSETSSCSPAGTGARTPTLVARLMGLDILPESTNSTPRSSTCTSQISSYSPHITSSTPPPSTRTPTQKTRIKSTYNNDVPGPRSLPNSPRSSASQRRKSTSTNVVEDHRRSLQINKENSIVKEMESSRPSCSAINTKRREGRKYEEENKSPGYYARQIMKQVRETVSRRVGADITNTISQREVRRDEHLLSSTTPTKSKKSSSPRLLSKSSETCKKVSETTTVNSRVSVSENIISASEVLKYDVKEVSSVPITKDKMEVKPLRSVNEKLSMKNEQHCSEKWSMKSSSKMLPKSYESVRNKKDEQFVRSTTRSSNNGSTDKKCNKKTMLSSDLVHDVSVHSIVPLKKDSISLQPPSKLLENQEGSSKAQVSKLINSISSTTINTPTRLSRSPGQRTYGKVQEEATYKPAVQEYNKADSTIITTATTTSTTTSNSEFQYISRILKCTGIDRDTPISFTRWFSPSHPLDPTIYHNLETTHYFTTKVTDHYLPSDHINRKLIFHLVDEILADILKPYIKSNPYHQYYHHHHHQQQQQINGFQLVKTLCTKIRSFPSANCQTLQDIDALVEKDFPGFGAASDSAAFEEEGEAIVVEIERDIVDSLVQEMAVFFLGSIRSSISMQRYIIS